MTRRPLLRASLVALTAAALALAGCSTSETDDEPAGSSGAATTAGATDAFPVTMKHALGTTTVDEAPKRVVTLGWGVADAALAVGVVPAAMEYQVYGSGADGIPPWTEQKIKSMGVKTPTVLPKATAEPAYDAILKASPDLILATSTGITAEQYKKLSDIAPTVAYTGKPYTTPWTTNVAQVAKALGREQQGKQVLAGIDKQISTAAAAHPELKGKTLAAVWDVGGTFYVYKKADARVGFMLDLGPSSAPSVDALANGKESFYYTLSHELVDQIDSDILVTYADTPALLKTFLAKPYAKGIPAVKTGAVAAIVGTEKVAAVSPPTAVSLPGALPGLVDTLSAAAKKAAAAK
ncbi:iron complex transport system substrate-binding protein [Jatrophihabitans endophyticus]|uniref:Iron complex transport system substrate-binding protein n=1 Tax=Jatrophihabitans endophyticus TaxID=1206085 RepID=A0A1M5GIB6_9ACTN|nr:iron-siderophore ABC transporter substrate-binding protein [Jatrophihabitans endophyticus]SHG03474.1 iron complex transport system substrate-binding protein [Jatrophihabitans endophyticus]